MGFFLKDIEAAQTAIWGITRFSPRGREGRQRVQFFLAIVNCPYGLERPLVFKALASLQLLPKFNFLRLFNGYFLMKG